MFNILGLGLHGLRVKRHSSDTDWSFCQPSVWQQIHHFFSLLNWRGLCVFQMEHYRSESGPCAPVSPLWFIPSLSLSLILSISSQPLICTSLLYLHTLNLNCPKEDCVGKCKTAFTWHSWNEAQPWYWRRVLNIWKYHSSVKGFSKKN